MKIALMIFISGFLYLSAQASELGAMLKNNDGVRKFEEKKSLEAFDRFNDALAEAPFSPEVHYNIATTFLNNKEYEKAVSEYRQAIDNSKGSSARAKETRFRSRFNMAVALTELKKIDEALEAYQQALAENPDSKEAKTNIELLTAAGGGGGEGDDQKQKQDKGDKKDNQQGKGKDEDKDKKQQPQNDQPKQKPTPKPFKSEELSQQDVGKILEELKRQEEQIRARMQNDKVKDGAPGKDW